MNPPAAVLIQNHRIIEEELLFLIQAAIWVADQDIAVLAKIEIEHRKQPDAPLSGKARKTTKVRANGWQQLDGVRHGGPSNVAAALQAGKNAVQRDVFAGILGQ